MICQVEEYYIFINNENIERKVEEIRELLNELYIGYDDFEFDCGFTTLTVDNFDDEEEAAQIEEKLLKLIEAT